MPLSRALMRQATYPRRIAWSSAIFGSLFFILFTLILLTFIWHKRQLQHQQLLHDSRDALQQSLDRLVTHTLNPLLSFSRFDCHAISQELTSRAAFAGDLRAILLVREGYAFCSSATGAFHLPLNAISDQTDLSRDRDLRLLSGTPLQPGKPVFALWLRNPQSVQSGVLATINLNLTPYQLLASYHPEISGMALVAQNSALASWQPATIAKSDLPPQPLMQLAFDGYPLQFVLYGDTVSMRDIQMIVLSGILLSLLVGGGCWLLLSMNQRPGKEILLGIKRGEFHVEYQPLISTLSGRAYGLEALLRWNHPSEGLIPPDMFISYAESLNLIIPLTRHLFELVARDAHRLNPYVPAGTHMSLNLSPLHLASESFQQDVKRWIAAMPDNHFSYVFEVTERTMVRDKNAGEVFAWLHQNDIQIAIDDFGTGHSALIYLEKYPFDYIKIDRGFVQSIGTQTLNSPVLDAVLHLAKKLNLKTVAEGVETGEQAAWLVQHGVSHMQGYLFSRPLKPDRLIDYYRSRSLATLAG
ncbi:MULTISPECIES: cyclic di-GMP phosphodiesterase [unclassified Pantoea]|uniref:cyclic di-GMP phosphodiesterase n=1 Tax=unclassified Pantoea TaxID=2630326 RepID=UPI00257B7BD1|nr:MULTISPECIES: cyclic di-GMP phosphodiesterase [unclassified Pantoea]MDU5472012.1 cyclic di-GMP phosphodiesterase [Pantoea sp.]